MTQQKQYYTKEALDYKDLVSLLHERGLSFMDEQKAIETFHVVSYFRIAAYLRPLEREGGNVTHQFKPKATFEQGIALYEFDTRLRDLVFRSIQRIEIALRTKMIHHFSLSHGAFWFLDMKICNSQKLYLQNLSSLEREISRSKEDFIKEHYAKYNYPEFPPAWKSLELASFGTLSKLYSNCSDNKIKKKIAREFNLPQHEVFESWLVSLASLRNCCAHHSRMWNRVFPAMPQMNVPLRGCWISVIPSIANRFYCAFSCLVYLHNSIDADNQLVKEFKELLIAFPSVDVAAMGFPREWQSEPIFANTPL